MTNEFYLALQFWLQTAWRFMTSFYLPGTNVTPAGMILFAATTVIGFTFLHRILDTEAPNDSKSSTKG